MSIWGEFITSLIFNWTLGMHWGGVVMLYLFAGVIPAILGIIFSVFASYKSAWADTYLPAWNDPAPWDVSFAWHIAPPFIMMGVAIVIHLFFPEILMDGLAAR